MTWARREVYPLAQPDDEGVAFLWRATFRKPNDDRVVEADGMDLALVRGELLSRNDVYFDRAVLAPFIAHA